MDTREYNAALPTAKPLTDSGDYMNGKTSHFEPSIKITGFGSYFQWMGHMTARATGIKIPDKHLGVIITIVIVMVTFLGGLFVQGARASSQIDELKTQITQLQNQNNLLQAQVISTDRKVAQLEATTKADAYFKQLAEQNERIIRLLEKER